jgi:predicted DNA binding CopG/RHH family protein
LAVPSNHTTVVTIRVKDALAERVKATAAHSGRSTNKFLNDIIAAMFGGDQRRG